MPSSYSRIDDEARLGRLSEDDDEDDDEDEDEDDGITVRWCALFP
jgi:hypothetical protein